MNAMLSVPIKKHEYLELPVPTLWRDAIKKLADSFVLNEPYISTEEILVKSIDRETSEINSSNIKDYPDAIGPLRPVTWDSSIYMWMGNEWEILIDLSTAEGKTSDLVMHLKIKESVEGYIIEPGLIYVP